MPNSLPRRAVWNAITAYNPIPATSSAPTENTPSKLLTITAGAVYRCNSASIVCTVPIIRCDTDTSRITPRTSAATRSSALRSEC